MACRFPRYDLVSTLFGPGDPSKGGVRCKLLRLRTVGFGLDRAESRDH
jgi:hypothetical protein